MNSGNASTGVGAQGDLGSRSSSDSGLSGTPAGSVSGSADLQTDSDSSRSISSDIQSSDSSTSVSESSSRTEINVENETPNSSTLSSDVQVDTPVANDPQVTIDADVDTDSDTAVGGAAATSSETSITETQRSTGSINDHPDHSSIQSNAAASSDVNVTADMPGDANANIESHSAVGGPASVQSGSSTSDDFSRGDLPDYDHEVLPNFDSSIFYRDQGAHGGAASSFSGSASSSDADVSTSYSSADLDHSSSSFHSDSGSGASASIGSSSSYVSMNSQERMAEYPGAKGGGLDLINGGRRAAHDAPDRFEDLNRPDMDASGSAAGSSSFRSDVDIDTEGVDVDVKGRDESWNLYKDQAPDRSYGQGRSRF